jgi:hypothetical protein
VTGDPLPAVDSAASAGSADPGATAESAASEVGLPGDRTGRRSWVELLLVIWLTLIGAAVGIVAFFFLPLWLGSVPFPISAVVAGVACWFLPRLVYPLTRSVGLSAAPVVAWFVVTIVLYFLPNPTYAVPLRIYAYAPWRMLVLVGLGALAGAASIGLLWGEHLRLQYPSSDVDRDPGPGGPPDAGLGAGTGNTGRSGRGTPRSAAVRTEPPRGEPS